ncbi:MAG: PspC domain-containing protein [Actinomycetia bacterium]|nr:PspC domain-containing protein [Actinomycetes bacterium]
MTEQPPADADGFDPGRVRTIDEMRRPSDDRMVAGVCAGMARHLNIDPVVVRVVIACLAFAGLAGVIIYVAGWLLIPEEGEEHGFLDRHLPANADVEQIRRVGLFAATAIAAVSAIGSGYALGPAGFPIALVALALFYVFAIRPYNKRKAASVAQTDRVAVSAETGSVASAGTAPPFGAPPTRGGPVGQRPARNPRRDGGRLFGITTLVAVIVIGCMLIDSESIDWPYFPLAALLVVGVGMVVGSYLGNGRPLALLGIPLAFIMLVTTLLPTYTIGDERHDPALASDVDNSYEQGVGNFVLDLSEISDLDSLDGRTVDIEQGVGSIEVLVPPELNVDVEARSDGGSLRLLGRSSDGAPVSSHYIDPADSDPTLHLDIDQTVGEIRVTRS